MQPAVAESRGALEQHDELVELEDPATAVILESLGGSRNALEARLDAIEREQVMAALRETADDD
mgnify:CR=1 FL=1